MIKREEMIVACCSDLAGKTRGKAFPAAEFQKRQHRGVGWTPTNVQITCFDVLGESPFGALGDLVLIPDPATLVSIDSEAGAPPERFAMGDIRHTDGTPWAFCTRSILKGALERLRRASGLTLYGAFEHEFQFRNTPGKAGDAFTLDGFRDERAFCEAVVAALRQAGVTPDTILREFGIGQFEVTIGPQRGVTIADHAIAVREVVKSIAGALGKSATFTPIRDPAGVGNGVHIHMSFLDESGRPATWQADGKHELSAVSGQFVAGILKYLDSFLALTAPSLVSYLRLTPHRWSAAFNNLGLHDREAAVRICPVSAISDLDRAAQFNFEFRAADAAASPYLQLAALVHAGAQGIEERLPTPDASREDLAALGADELAARHYVRLPQTLEAALERLQASPTVAGWFPPAFVETYVKHKQAEIQYLNGKDLAETCAAYEAVY